jgi:hypothetical protein
LYYIIETEEQLSKYCQYDLSQCYVDVVPYNDHYHNAISPASLVYIRPFRSRAGFILPINHSETLSLSYSSIANVVNELIGKVYAVNAKRLKYYFRRKGPLYCLRTGLFLTKGVSLDESDYNTNSHRFFYSKYGNLEDVNKIIPVSKHYEKLEKMISLFKNPEKLINTAGYDTYGELATKIFHYIEKTGISIDQKEFDKHFSPRIKDASIKDGKIYSQYNMQTATGRPSDSFNGINFAALKKEDGSRKAIIPSNDFLVEFDYSSYHLRILCNLINYTFGDDDIHKHLAKHYYNKEDITKEEYDESKGLTFRLLYNEYELEEVENIPFFSKVRDFKHTMWDQYKKDGYIKSFLTGKRLTGIETKTQILPYILQDYETARNLTILSNLLKFLNNKRSRLILYCYDSFLIDYSKEDGKALLNDILGILQEGGYKTSAKFGKNYQDMKSI